MNFPTSDSPRIAVLYGGVGSERSVSLISGKAVLDAMGEGFPYEVVGMEVLHAALPDGLDPRRDVVLLVLHGEFGEDGQVQQLLEAAGVHYAGCNARSSALCMDKAATKQCLQDAGVPVVDGCVLHSGTSYTADVDQWIAQYGTELIVKPLAMGSSVGLCEISGVEALRNWLAQPECSQHSWVLERRIRGREFSVAVLNGHAMGVVEIAVPEGRIYDFEQKYHRADTQYVCPADLNGAHTHQLRRLAEQAFGACGCRDYARVDFLYETQTDQFYALEMNTLPGMTPSSLMPKSASALGYSFNVLLRQMIAPAVARFREQKPVGHVTEKPEIRT